MGGISQRASRAAQRGWGKFTGYSLPNAFLLKVEIEGKPFLLARAEAQLIVLCA